MAIHIVKDLLQFPTLTACYRLESAMQFDEARLRGGKTFRHEASAIEIIKENRRKIPDVMMKVVAQLSQFDYTGTIHRE